MQKLRVGLVGAGLVGQAEHAFYLWDDRDRFEFAALADASPSVRAAVGARYGVPALYATLGEMLAARLDAVVIAAPDPFHPELAVAALDGGLHVLCEKPLALTVAGCNAIAAARDRSGCIVQVAYMKRHDPAYRRALALLPERIEDVRLIAVEVNDPDQDPFVAHLPMVSPADLPAPLRAEADRKAQLQLDEAAERKLNDREARALANGFFSAMVHDVAVVHGILARLGCELPAEAGDGRIFDNGRGVHLSFPLPGDGRAALTHLNLPGVPDYTERITVYCTDRIIELTFPSPYLRHFPTRLTVRRGAPGHTLELIDERVSFEEAFREQLRAFHAAVLGVRPVETPLEQARRDIELLTSAFHRAIT
jgi:predicted dehydrogenase